MKQPIYINREESWLEFNARVLEEALLSDTPILEKLKFLGIFASNLDEFFMVRVAGLKKMESEGIVRSDSPEDVDPRVTLSKLRRRTNDLVAQMYRCYDKEILPALKKRNVKILKFIQTNEKQKQFLRDYFELSVFPVLTPLSYDPAHPFPFLSNLSLYLAVLPGREGVQQSYDLPSMCFVEIPSVLPRLIALPTEGEDQYEYLLLEDLVSEFLDRLFYGVKMMQSFSIRVTRNFDYTLLENEVTDLLAAMKKEVISREHQEVVRLQVDEECPAHVVKVLKENLSIEDADVFKTPRPMNIRGLMPLYKLPLSGFKDSSFNPRLPQRMDGHEDIFSIIAQGDLLLHHPYESFYAVTEFLASAAADPHVLAIKQTLYRTVGDSPIVDSLVAAAENGKQVTALIELKARFDERNNIVWARKLERAGVNVVFGFVGLKTHSKATLVVRREDNKLVQYVHLSTGNYNPDTAKLYTDVALLSRDQDLAHDVTVMFNLLTGFNLLSVSKDADIMKALPKLRSIALAPLNLRETLLELIDCEIANSKKGKTGYIIAKMNALVDRVLIDKLYEASGAGVKIDLVIRGICCLRPGVEGLSENIEVTSIIDRFLEHSRIYYFHAGGKDKVFFSSADWMPRNMDRRIEQLFPIRDQAVKARVLDEILHFALLDNCKSSVMGSDGLYVRKKRRPGEGKIRSQTKFIELARKGGIKSIPYDIAIRHNPTRKRGERPVAKKKNKGKK